MSNPPARRFLLPVALVLAAASEAQQTWDFEHSFNSVFEPQADTYLVHQQNVTKVQESWGPAFWTPSNAGSLSTLRYHIPLPHPTTSIHAFAQLYTTNYSLGVGYGSIWASADGTNWTQLLDGPAPTGVVAQSFRLDADLPTSFLGTRDLWLEVRMVRQSGSYPYGAVQFSRYEAGYTVPAFGVQVRWDSTPPASVSPLGNGCPGSHGIPTLTATNPVFGHVFQFHTTQLTPHTFAWLLIANNLDPWNNLPLPVDLQGLGMPSGCMLHVNAANAVTVGLVADSTGTASFAVQMPPAAAVFLRPLHLQMAAIDPNLPTQIPVVWSNALTAQPGI